MARLRTVLFFALGVIPASVLCAVAVPLSLMTLAAGGVKPFLLGALGVVGTLAMWTAFYSIPNIWIHLGLVCGIGAAYPIWTSLLLVPYTRTGEDLVLSAFGFFALLASIVATLYIVGLFRPYPRDLSLSRSEADSAI